MESFIVRIYRRGDAAGQDLAGTVEQIGCEGTCSFSSAAELNKILHSGDLSRRPESPGGSRGTRPDAAG